MRLYDQIISEMLAASVGPAADDTILSFGNGYAISTVSGQPEAVSYDKASAFLPSNNYPRLLNNNGTQAIPRQRKHECLRYAEELRLLNEETDAVAERWRDEARGLPWPFNRIFGGA